MLPSHSACDERRRTTSLAARVAPHWMGGRRHAHHPVGMERSRPGRDAAHRHAPRVSPSTCMVARTRAARRRAPGRRAGILRPVDLGPVAGQGIVADTARAGGSDGAGLAVPAGGESHQEPQPHQLPLGLADVRGSGRAGGALAMGRGRWRAGAMLPGRTRFQRLRLHCTVPALARACGGLSAAHRSGFSLVGRRDGGGSAGRRGADVARRASAESHAVDLADLQRCVVGRLAAAAGHITSPGRVATADRPASR
jgi:hypothetical protein